MSSELPGLQNIQQYLNFHEDPSETLEQTKLPHPFFHSNLHLKIIRIIKAEHEDVQLIENIDRKMNKPIPGNVNLAIILELLEKQYNLHLEKSDIFLLKPDDEIYMNCGSYPLMQEIIIEINQFTERMFVVKQQQDMASHYQSAEYNLMTIKVVSSLDLSMLQREMMKDMSQNMIKGPPKLLPENNKLQVKTKKRKIIIKNFQKIGYIVDKVLRIKQQNKVINADSTLKINKNTEKNKQMTKKSLEDYYYQIKMGHKFNFNFNEYARKDMKQLRRFVKKRIEDKKNEIKEKQILVSSIEIMEKSVEDIHSEEFYFETELS